MLRRLSNESNKVIKGLLVGNVQSGKTANMTALISMAADNGFDLFIMLAGSKNTLKEQSIARLQKDLGDDGFKEIDITKRPEYLSYPSYITVIKSTGLEKLKEYLSDYKNSINLKDKKIIIIDDECDEASMDTNSEEKNSTKINRLIKDILEGKTDKGEIKYGAMNYIGYTATPWANIFGYNGEDDLFPDFMHSLSNSSIYFGPEQIFGVNENKDAKELSCLSILNHISDKDKTRVSKIENRSKLPIPKSLKDAIYYFYCSVACIRYWQDKTYQDKKYQDKKYIEPSTHNAVTMMIHTNREQNPHEYLSQAIEKWLKEEDKKDFIKNCENVWGDQTERFPLKDFKKQFKSYGIEDITDYPKFTDLKKYIIDNKKIHTNVDKKSKINTNGDTLNLLKINYKKIENYIYDVSDDKEIVPYILVGGDMLSRGLTLERLVVSYFTRLSGQADTHMQRGRWFGYRVGYELLPRIWITDEAKALFKETTDLDRLTRDRFKDMAKEGRSPIEFYIDRPKGSKPPTARNKSKGLEKISLNYRDSTTSSMIPKNAIESNLALTDKFISECKLTQGKRKHNRYAYISKNISYSDIKKYVEKFKHDNAEIQKWLKGYEENHEDAKTQGWNVILVSKKEANNGIWTSKIGDINAVERKYDEANQDKYVFSSIMVFRDLLDDIDDDISQSEITSEDISNLRKKAGVDKTPQLLIYIIGIKNTKIATISLYLPSNLNNKDFQEGYGIKKISKKIRSK